MPMEGCAFVCGILAFISGILSWYSLSTGDTAALVPAFVFAVIEAAISAYVLIMRYCQ